MDRNRTVSIDEVLESILRGAAKIIGGNSANLIVFNEVRKEVRIRIGLLLERQIELAQVEEILGGRINDLVFTFAQTEKTELYRSFREREVMEVSTLTALARGAFPEALLRAADEHIGEHRFLFIPVLGENACYGVLVFEKNGVHSFSPQQRELAIRYANRIGEIIENETRSFRFADPAAPDDLNRPLRVLIDPGGKVVGQGHREEAFSLPEPLHRELVDRVSKMLSEGGSATSFIDGEYEAEIEPFDLGGKSHAMCQLRKAERKPDRSIQNHLLQIALQKSAPALFLDPDFCITSCNDATRSLLDYGPEELTGKDVGFLFPEQEDIRTILNTQFLFVSDGHYEEIAVVRNKDGALLPAKVEALMLADEANRVIGYLVLIREQDQKENTDDGAGIEHLMRRERLANMGEIAAQLAHEIRNPLLAIGATLESLQRDQEEGDGDGLVLSSLSNEISRLDMILKDYLSLAVRQNATVTRVNISHVVDDACGLLMGLGNITGKRIESDLPPDLEIYADYDGLKQVFFNLFMNAMEASPTGGEVTCRLEESGGMVVVHVEDSGPGLKARPDDCFTPFFSTKSNGTGLGLSVCRKILEAHSGTIRLENREAGGCRASVVMPRRVK